MITIRKFKILPKFNKQKYTLFLNQLLLAIEYIDNNFYLCTHISYSFLTLKVIRCKNGPRNVSAKRKLFEVLIKK